MNIFFLDKTPYYSAVYLHDVHLRKMIIEYAQILSTVLHKNNAAVDDIYKSTHKNHPCVLWAGESSDNYRWLKSCALSACFEYEYRFNKTHATYKVMDIIYDQPIPVIKHCGFTDPPLCMPDEYKVTSYVQSYRQYYFYEKQFDKNGKFIGKYTKREEPLFLKAFYEPII